MPLIKRIDGYRFFFYSNEGIPREPVHVHIRKGEATAKVWLVPEIMLELSYGFSSSELTEIIKITMENHEMFMRSWNEYFGE
jgi:hypothetical protein